MNFSEKTINNEIMSTDIFISVCSDTISQSEIEDDINSAIQKLKNFEAKYSRFLESSELTKLNDSTEMSIDEEFIHIIETAKEYYKRTEGMFNPAILPILKNEGYVISKNSGYKNAQNTQISDYDQDFSKVLVSGNKVFKPNNLKIDLGGIGKGYAADMLTSFFKTKYENFIVNLGGDMYCSGADKRKNYEYWAIEIEPPYKDFKDKLPLLIVKNAAVATSGVNKRRWSISESDPNLDKNHIIEPNSKISLENDLITVTVIGQSTTYADVFAKVLLIMGLDRAKKYCHYNNIAAILVGKSQEVFVSKEASKYVWNEK